MNIDKPYHELFWLLWGLHSVISAIRDAAADATCAAASSAAASAWERGDATIPGKCLRLGGIEY